MTAKVASIYFMARHAERRIYGGNFPIPAVPKGEKPFILTVPDHIERNRLPFILGRGVMPRQIRGEDIARDIVREWSAEALGMSVDCGPGIWVVRETAPLRDDSGKELVDEEGYVQTRPATDEERAEWWTEDVAFQTMRQENWAAYLKEQGDMLHADPEKKRHILISPTMRAAAAYYGYSVDWMDHKLREGDRKACQFCTKIIPANAIKCPECSEVVDAARYAMAKEIDRLSAKNALKVQQQEQPTV